MHFFSLLSSSKPDSRPISKSLPCRACAVPVLCCTWSAFVLCCVFLSFCAVRCCYLVLSCAHDVRICVIEEGRRKGFPFRVRWLRSSGLRGKSMCSTAAPSAGCLTRCLLLHASAASSAYIRTRCLTISCECGAYIYGKHGLSRGKFDLAAESASFFIQLYTRHRTTIG